MRPEDVTQVWTMLDLNSLADLVRQGPTPVFATISGAHLYGFASPDSDVDLRGAFLLPAREILGLQTPRETITVESHTSMDLDWVAHDLRKFARMMTNHNGYVLEQLFSPLVVTASEAFEELKELGKGCVTRPTVRHYLGFANGRRRRLQEPDPTVKHLLYAYRVLLSGIHLMRTGEVVSNLPMLNENFRHEQVNELMHRKREGAEKMALNQDELKLHGRILDQLDTDLNEAHARSTLPEQSTTRDALNDFVIRVRLQHAESVTS